MSEFQRLCPGCGQPVLGLTGNEEVASCPSCGRFFEHYRPPARSRWPATWKMALALCGPMLLVALMRAAQWWSFRVGQKTLSGVLAEANYILLPLVWFGWPLVGAWLLARRYAAFPDRWMSTLGLGIAGMVGNTAIMLASMLLQLFF